MASILQLLLPLAAATSVWLGSASVARADCTDDADCKSPRICDAGACREAQCAADADCLGSQACERGRCAARAGSCKSDVDCPGDQLCVASVCTAEPACKSDVDCPGEQVCDGSRCGAAGAAPPPPPGVVPIGPPPGPPGPPAAAAEPVRPDAPGRYTQQEVRASGRSALIVGAVLFGGAYLISLGVTEATSRGRATEHAAIPLVGPIVIMTTDDVTTGGTIYYAVDGVCQAVGLFLVGLGIAGVANTGGAKRAARRGDFPWRAFAGADPTVRVSTLAPDGRGPGLGLGFTLP